MEVYFDTWILYLIHEIGVEHLCITQDFLRGEIFVRVDSILCTTRDFFRGDVFVRGDSFFDLDCLFC